MVTVAQLKELNRKIDQLKDQNSAAIAELKVLQGQFDAKADELSKTLNIKVTAENVEALYQQAQQQLEEKAGRIDELLRDLQGSGQPNAFTHPATGPAGFGTPLQQMMPQNNFGTTPVMPPTFNPAQSQSVPPPGLGSQAGQAPNTDGQGVAPTFANFGTGTTFKI